MDVFWCSLSQNWKKTPKLIWTFLISRSIAESNRTETKTKVSSAGKILPGSTFLREHKLEIQAAGKGPVTESTVFRNQITKFFMSWHFVINYETNNGSYRVFILQKNSLAPEVLIELLDLVFHSLQRAAWLSVVFGFVLNKVEDDSFHHFQSHEQRHADWLIKIGGCESSFDKNAFSAEQCCIYWILHNRASKHKKETLPRTKVTILLPYQWKVW